MPLTPEIAVASTIFPADFQGDPADRMIVATAMQHKIAVVTKDERIRDSKLVATIW